MLDHDKFKKIEQNIGYTFKNKQLLKTALFPNIDPKHHQLIENVGDAYLTVIIREWSFKRFVNDNEKYLTFIQHAYSNIILSLVAENIGVLEHIDKEQAHLYRPLDKGYANIMEAIFWAIKQDGGMKQLEKVVLNIIPLDKIVDIEIISLNGSSVKKNAKKCLFNWGELHNPNIDPCYKNQCIKPTLWKCILKVGNIKLTSQDSSAELAEQSIARKMLNILEQDRLRKILFK